MTPHLGVAVLDESGETIKEFEYEEKSGIVSEETSETMRMIHEKCGVRRVREKTDILRVFVGGKTDSQRFREKPQISFLFLVRDSLDPRSWEWS